MTVEASLVNMKFCTNCICTWHTESSTVVIAEPHTDCPEHGAAAADVMVGKCWGVGRTLLTPLDLQPWMVDPRKIAQSLSKICRFAGQCAGFVPVAFHSVNVMCHVRDVQGITDNKILKTALMHDAPEGCGLQDMIRPVKRHPAMMQYEQWHDDSYRVIAQVLDLCDPMPRYIKLADDAVLAEELANFNDPYYGMDPLNAYEFFMHHWTKL